MVHFEWKSFGWRSVDVSYLHQRPSHHYNLWPRITCSNSTTLTAFISDTLLHRNTPAPFYYILHKKGDRVHIKCIQCSYSSYSLSSPPPPPLSLIQGRKHFHLAVFFFFKDLSSILWDGFLQAKQHNNTTWPQPTTDRQNQCLSCALATTRKQMVQRRFS